MKNFFRGTFLKNGPPDPSQGLGTPWWGRRGSVDPPARHPMAAKMAALPGHALWLGIPGVRVGLTKQFVCGQRWLRALSECQRSYS